MFQRIWKYVLSIHICETLAAREESTAPPKTWVFGSFQEEATGLNPKKFVQSLLQDSL